MKLEHVCSAETGSKSTNRSGKVLSSEKTIGFLVIRFLVLAGVLKSGNQNKASLIEVGTKQTKKAKQKSTRENTN